MGISSGVGLMSGLETESIITATMAVESAPIIRLQSTQAAYQAKISSYGALSSVLNNLSSAVSSLADSDTFDAGYSASSSDSDILTVQASDSASAGTYNIIVEQLATSAQMTSNIYTDSDTDVGSGTLQFKVGDGDKESVAISTEDQSLEDIAAAINDADMDVTASVIKVSENDYRMSIVANDTGKNIDFSFQEEGFTFSTTTQASGSAGEVMESEEFDSDSNPLGISGTLSVNGTDITLDGTESLNDIQSSIDSIDGLSATVNYDDTSGKYTLEVESDVDDTNIDLNYSNSDDTEGFSALIDDSATVEANMALLSINNIAIEREDNSIDDLITGVTIDLVGADLEETITVSVNDNHDNAATAMETFVTAYNSAAATIASLQSYDGESGTAGTLLGDSTTNMLSSGLKRMLFTNVDGINESVNNLSSLGIELLESGQLEFNSSTFTSAMDDYSSDVTSFFTQESSGAQGLAVQFDTFLDGYLGSGGIITAKEDGYNTSISKIDDDITALNYRLDKREANLRQQYINLEEIMAGLTSTSSYLTDQLSVISNMTSGFYT